jgi:hypothetical protein
MEYKSMARPKRFDNLVDRERLRDPEMLPVRLGDRQSASSR